MKTARTLPTAAPLLLALYFQGCSFRAPILAPTFAAATGQPQAPLTPQETYQLRASMDCPATVLLQKSGGWLGERTVELALYEDGTLIYWSHDYREYRTVQLNSAERVRLVNRVLQYPSLSPRTRDFPVSRSSLALDGYQTTLQVRLPGAYHCLAASPDEPADGEASSLRAIQGEVLKFLREYQDARALPWIPETVILEFSRVAKGHREEFAWRDDWPHPESGKCSSELGCTVAVTRSRFEEMKQVLWAKRGNQAARIDGKLWFVDVAFPMPHEVGDWRTRAYEAILARRKKAP